MVRTILIKAIVQRKDNMRCTHDRNASGRFKEGERPNVDHIEYKKLFVSRCHFCDLMSTGQDQRYCFNTVSFGAIKATLYEDY